MTALRKIVGFDLFRHGKLLQLGRQSPVTGNDPFYEAVMREPVEALVLAVPDSRGVYQRQPAGLPGFQEPLLEGADQLFGGAASHDTVEGNGITAANDAHGLIRRNDFAALHVGFNIVYNRACSFLVAHRSPSPSIYIVNFPRSLLKIH